MSEDKNGEGDVVEGAEAAPKKKINPMILVIIALLLGAIISAGVVFFVMKSKHHDTPPVTEEASDSDDKKTNDKKDDKKDAKKDDKHVAEADKNAPLEYFPLPQAFLVLLQPTEKDSVGKYLQLSITVSFRGEAVKKAMAEHDPLIRNDVVMALSKYTDKQALSADGRKKMQADVQEAINLVLKREAKISGVESVLFIQLVVQ